MTVNTKTSKNILVVEDNVLNRKLFCDLLESEGYGIVETEDGDLVVGLVEKHNPDLIVMDIQLQGTSGYDVIKELKASNEYKHIPIIAVTAFAMKHDKAHILSSGCDVYLAKPIAVTPFLNVINRFLNPDKYNKAIDLEANG